MNGLTWLGLLISPAMLAPMLVLAGLLVMFPPTRRWGGALIALVLVSSFMPLFEPVFEALFAAMPGWLVPLVIAAGFVSLVGGGRCVRDVLAHVVGDLLASLLRFLFALPWRVLAGLFRLLSRNH